ncbi:MAG: SMC-Scp complex subunit ScpB [Eubacteriales bacterium]|jgi:segregation and condensation protein B
MEAALMAILFAAGEPVSLERLAGAMDAPEEIVETALTELSDRLSFERAGIRLSRMRDAYQLATAPEFADLVRRTLETRRPPSLSQAALETVAILAYREPCTRAYIERIRGVDSTYTLSSLCDKGLAEEAGRLEVPGRPILYRLTANALRMLGVTSVEELPPLPEGEELPANTVETSTEASEIPAEASEIPAEASP